MREVPHALTKYILTEYSLGKLTVSANAPKIGQQALEFNEAEVMLAHNSKKNLSSESSHQPLTEKKRNIRVVNTSSSKKASSSKKEGAREASAPNQQAVYEELRIDEELRTDIAQLLKLVANTLDAHSVFLLLPSLNVPSELFGSFSSFRTYDEVAAGNSIAREQSQSPALTPFASQTLSPKALPKKQVPIHAGPLLWVAKTGKPLHISPFEMEATGLGVYGTAVPLKSLAAVPIACERISQKMQSSAEHQVAEYQAANSLTSPLKRGVLLVDSLKAYKFTPLQVKLLQQLGAQIERILELHADRFNLLRDRISLSNQQALPPQQEYHHEEFKVSKGHAGSKIQADPKKFRSQIEVLLREDNVKTLSVASISLTVPTLTVPSLSVPTSQKSAMERQAVGTLETHSLAQRLSRGLLTTHFPVQRLLTLPEQIQEVWTSSTRDFHEFLNSELNTPGGEDSELLSTSSGSMPSGSQIASLVTGQQIIFVCDHLRVAMLTKKIRGLFLFYLRKKLQFAIEDPREAVFEAITQELLTVETASLKSLIAPNASRDTKNTAETKEYGCIGKWLQYALSEGMTLRSPILQNSKPPIRKWDWLRSDFPNPWKDNSKKPENLERAGNGLGIFARSSLSLEGESSLGKTSRANDDSIQTLRYQTSREQNQPLHQRRAS